MTKRGKLLLLIAVAAAVLCAPLSYIVSCFPPFGGLELPCPQKGRVVDADTGEPIAGAVVSVKWQVYDYPMLDGAGSYPVSVQARTDNNGMFSLPRPRHRSGFFNTEMHPPYIRASGYRDFTYSDWPELARPEGDVLVYPLRLWARIEAEEQKSR